MIEHNPLTPTEFPTAQKPLPLNNYPVVYENPSFPIPSAGAPPKYLVSAQLAPLKQHYVVGFLFFNSLRGQQVMLIEKRTGPKWMKGLLNGVGGKVEPGEDAWHAMRREFAEEAGVAIHTWKYFTNLGGPDWTMDCYFARANEDQFMSCVTRTEEPLVPMSVSRLIFDPEVKAVPNVAWMVTMALHFEKDPYGPYNVTVGESHITGKKFAGSPTAEKMAA